MDFCLERLLKPVQRGVRVETELYRAKVVASLSLQRTPEAMSLYKVLLQTDGTTTMVVRGETVAMAPQVVVPEVLEEAVLPLVLAVQLT